MGAAARVAARTLALVPAAQRTQALHALADALRTQHSPVLAANAADLAAAHSAGISAPLAERLLLNAPVSFPEPTIAWRGETPRQ